MGQFENGRVQQRDSPKEQSSRDEPTAEASDSEIVQQREDLTMQKIDRRTGKLQDRLPARGSDSGMGCWNDPIVGQSDRGTGCQ